MLIKSNTSEQINLSYLNTLYYRMYSNEKDTKNLSELLSKLQTLYHQKKEQLEVLHQEIEELRSILSSLNTLISTKSFLSADQLYSEEKKPPEDYFKEDVSQEEFKGTNVKRKIFSEDNNALMCGSLELTTCFLFLMLSICGQDLQLSLS